MSDLDMTLADEYNDRMMASAEDKGTVIGNAKDGKPLDYVDDDGVQWVMCACGHRAGGGVKVGDKIALCPNCKFLIRFGGIDIVYPHRLPDSILPKGMKVVPDA